IYSDFRRVWNASYGACQRSSKERRRRLGYPPMIILKRLTPVTGQDTQYVRTVLDWDGNSVPKRSREGPSHWTQFQRSVGIHHRLLVSKCPTRDAVSDGDLQPFNYRHANASGGEH